MRCRNRKFGVLLVAALALVPTAAILPAGAATVPAAPAKPAAAPLNAGPTTGSVRVTWVAPANGGSAINQYVVTPFIGANAQAARVFNNTAVTEIITGLTTGT